MRKMAEFCKLYLSPSYHDLCWKFLVQAKEELQAHLQVKMVENVPNFKATLSDDGRSLVTNCPLFNAILVFLAVEQFLRSMDTTRYQKIVQYQASIMVKYIEEVSPYKVLQICTTMLHLCRRWRTS